MSIDSVMKSIRDNDVRYIDLRFTDILGKEMHFTVPVECFDEDSFEFGHPFDGSHFRGDGAADPGGESPAHPGVQPRADAPLRQRGGAGAPDQVAPDADRHRLPGGGLLSGCHGG